ncbi:MAG: hypothetical protein OHK0038_26510 [Flammeovirgaceae bacterium]
MNYSFPFEKVWYGVDLPELREANATYGGAILDFLPTIKPEFLDGSFWYLSNESSLLKENNKLKRRLKDLESQLPKNLKLPDSMLKFLSAPNAQECIHSCTACYFDMPDMVSRFNWLGENGYLFHFYRDQQDCLFWYYYVRENGESCILVSAIPFYKEGIDAQLNDDIIQNEVFFTATTFDEFIFRTWLENELWYNLVAKKAFENQQTEKVGKEYIEEYKRNLKK